MGGIFRSAEMPLGAFPGTGMREVENKLSYFLPFLLSLTVGCGRKKKEKRQTGNGR